MSRIDATLALRALGIDPDAGKPLSFESDVKRAYRRTAMALHPDRNQSLSPQEASHMEERFKNAKLAYEALSALFDAGLWPPPIPRRPGPDRIVFPAFDAPIPSPAPAATSPPPSPADPLILWAQVACDSLAHAATLNGAAFDTFLNASAAWAVQSGPALGSNPRLSTAFLRAFWSKTEPGIFLALDQYRAKLLGLGRATLADALDPFVASSGPKGNGGFGLLSAIAHAAPPLLSERERAYYRQAFAATPLLLDFCATEALLDGSNRSAEPFLSQLLERAPELAEMLAERSKRAALPLADWLALCVRSAARPAALVHLLEPDALDAILDAARSASPQRAQAWMSALSPRAIAEGRWDLASLPGASEPLASCAQALLSLSILRADCDELGSARPERLYAPDQRYARRAMSRALDGDAPHALHILEQAPDPGSALYHRGWHLCAACAARAYLEPTARARMLLAIDFLARALGPDILLARDPFGRSAADWLALPHASPTPSPPRLAATPQPR